MGVDSLPHVPVGGLQVDPAVADLDDLPGIQPFATDSEGRELPFEDLRGEQFAVTLDRFQAGGTEFSEQVDALYLGPQVFEQAVDDTGQFLLEHLRKQFPDDRMVPLLQFLQQVRVGFIPPGRPAAGFNQGISATADGRTDEDGPVGFQRLGDDGGYLADGGSGGDGTAAEFHDLHMRSRMG